MKRETISEHLEAEGISRREFMSYCGVLAGALGLSQVAPLAASGLPADLGRPATVLQRNLTETVARALETKPRQPVIWLEFQDCAGCTEAITRSTSPTLVELILNKMALNYHETLFAAAGHQAEAARADAMEKYAGEYLLVVEGSVPVGDPGFCTIGGRTAEDILREAARGAAAVISVGSCASFGGLPAANPNPTGARSAADILSGTTVVNIPGCPAIPEATTGVLTHFLVFGELPELDDLNRPTAFYGTTIHDRCLRRPFYDEGKFANSFDDAGARKGWCLYKLGCKGPTTYNACAVLKWNGGVSFPIESGHPCLGCSQPDFWDNGGFYQGQSSIIGPPGLGSAATAVGIGAVVGAGVAAVNIAKRRDKGEDS